jgi:hypothetical protein
MVKTRPRALSALATAHVDAALMAEHFSQVRDFHQQFRAQRLKRAATLPSA